MVLPFANLEGDKLDKFWAIVYSAVASAFSCYVFDTKSRDAVASWAADPLYQMLNGIAVFEVAVLQNPLITSRRNTAFTLNRYTFELLEEIMTWKIGDLLGNQLVAHSIYANKDEPDLPKWIPSMNGITNTVIDLLLRGRITKKHLGKHLVKEFQVFTAIKHDLTAADLVFDLLVLVPFDLLVREIITPDHVEKAVSWLTMYKSICDDEDKCKVLSEWFQMTYDQSNIGKGKDMYRCDLDPAVVRTGKIARKVQLAFAKHQDKEPKK